MGVRYFCDGDGCDFDDLVDDTDLTRCDGDCFGEFCDACLKVIGEKRFCEECHPKEAAKVPGGDLLDSPLLNPVPVVDWSWPWQQEESVAT